MKCAATVVTVLLWLLIPVGAVDGAEDDALAPLRQQSREALGVERLHLEMIELPAALQNGQLAVPVTIGGEARTLVLWPHSLRGPDFKVMTRGEGGLEPAPAPAPCTYRGRVAGQPDARVAATIRDGNLWAVVLDEQTRWSIQPLAELVDGAAPGLHAVVDARDIVEGQWSCGVDDAPFPGGGVAGGGGGPAGLVGCVAVAEIAFDSDFEYYELNGQSVPATVADIESVMNTVELIYAGQVGIAYTITQIMVQTDPDLDPYTTSNFGVLLDEFRQYWNDNNADIPRDVAHLMTGKDLDGSVIGVAWLGVVCFTEQAYGLSQSRFTENFDQRVILTAHELGHNWSAGHCNAEPDCGIMCSSVSGCDGPSTVFGVLSQDTIIAYRDSSDCLGVEDELILLADDKLIADDPEQSDFFGRAVALDGEVAVVGAYQDDQAGNNAGAAYVFRFDGVEWVQETKLIGDDTEAGDLFGSAVAIDGDRIVVGAHFDDDVKLGSGSVYVFNLQLDEFGDFQWVQEAKLTSMRPFNGDNFGIAVDIDGDWIVVGVPNDDPMGGNSGSVQPFRFVFGEWVAENSVTADDRQSGDLFGRAVALSRNDDGEPLLVVGAPEANFDAGAAYAFRFNIDEWIQETEFVPSVLEFGDEFGSTVSIDGELTIIGASKQDEPGDPKKKEPMDVVDSGAAFLFFREPIVGGAWSEITRITAPTPVENERFGVSVSVADDLLMVGAFLSDVSAEDAGAAYAFRAGKKLEFLDTISAADAFAFDQFGIAISASNEAALIGAWLDDEYEINSGAAYVITVGAVSALDCNQNGVLDQCDLALGTSGDCNHNDIPDECDIADGTSLDRDGNGIPDDCDFDCNGNGIPDSGDIAVGISFDCNENGVPDDCDISAGTSTDVDYNLVPDDCQVDCNENGIPDDWEVGIGLAPDCNQNGIPDDCDQIGFVIDSGEMGPVLAGFTSTIDLVAPPFAEGDVEILISANADLDFSSENIAIHLDGQLVGTVFGSTSGIAPIGCPLDLGLPLSEDVQTVDDVTWNLAAVDGSIQLEFIPSSAVNSDCDDPGSYMIVQITYAGGDCNQNGLVDSCEVADGLALDCNGNLVPDECEPDCDENGVADSCDIAEGAPDVDDNGVPDICQADCQPNGIPDEFEIATEMVIDCNENGVPDECDLADGFDTDKDGNGILDGCDFDCNNNGIADGVDIGTNTSFDCNDNGFPDECDIGFLDNSEDCNENGVPDECDPDSDGDGIPDDCADTCPGDTNNDGSVNVTDLINLISTWGGDGQGAGFDADINDDGVVNVTDLVQGVINNWGPCP